LGELLGTLAQNDDSETSATQFCLFPEISGQ
jgi:hypothetical protein